MAGGNWYDHMPPGMLDWSEPHPDGDGIMIDGRHFDAEYVAKVLDLVPRAELKKAEREIRRLEQEREAATEVTRKKARKEAMESKRLARLENLKRMTAESPQWKRVRGERWPKWHVFDAELGHLVDTGAKLTDKGIEYPPGWVFPEGYEPPRPGE